MSEIGGKTELYLVYALRNIFLKTNGVPRTVWVKIVLLRVVVAYYRGKLFFTISTFKILVLQPLLMTYWKGLVITVILGTRSTL